MVREPQVVTNLVLYDGEKILCQCGFQSLKDSATNTFRSTDGCDLKVTHFYKDTTCTVEVLYQKNDHTIYSLDLDIPINRTKLKWKKTKLGVYYKLCYRSGLEPTA